MPGDGDKIRGEKYLRKLAQSDSFKESLARARDRLVVLAEGIEETEVLRKWLRTKFDEKKVDKEVSNIIEKHELPNSRWWRRRIAEYILVDRYTFMHDLIAERPFVEILDKGSSLGGGYTDLRIYADVSQRDIISFLKEHWYFILPSNRYVGGMKITSEKFPARNKLIIDEWKKMGKGASVFDRAMTLSRFLRESHQIKIEPETIIALVQRKRKPKKRNNTD